MQEAIKQIRYVPNTKSALSYTYLRNRCSTYIIAYSAIIDTMFLECLFSISNFARFGYRRHLVWLCSSSCFGYLFYNWSVEVQVLFEFSAAGTGLEWWSPASSSGRETISSKWFVLGLVTDDRGGCDAGCLFLFLCLGMAPVFRSCSELFTSGSEPASTVALVITPVLWWSEDAVVVLAQLFDMWPLPATLAGWPLAGAAELTGTPDEVIFEVPLLNDCPSAGGGCCFDLDALVLLLLSSGRE